MTRLRANRWLASGAGGASLLAAAMVTAALFLPFVSQGCAGCSAFYGAGLPAAALRVSPDAWAVVWILGILASTAVLFLAGVGVRLMAILSAAASLATLGLAIFEGAVAFPRTLPAAELLPGVPVYYVLDSGYYLFLIGGAVAVVAAAAMSLVGGDERINPRALGHPGAAAAAGWACLVVVAIAFAGAFLPFAALNCGFGCPAFVGPSPGSFSGAIAGSADGLIVLILLGAAALATTVRVAGRSKALASSSALLLAFAATALVSFDSLNGATRVLGWPFAIPTSPEQGYYLLQIGSALAVVLSFVLVVADRPTWGLHRGLGLGGREATRSA
jgi:hypothetical protein